MEIDLIKKYLAASAARHTHLCPRQVLGVRIALAGTAALKISIPRTDHLLLVIVEIDGCFTDGIQVVTGVSVGSRTLRVEDYGKVAATFINARTQEAYRVTPRLDARLRAGQYAAEEPRHYFAQLRAYEYLEDADLLQLQPVRLSSPVQQVLGRPGVHVNCERCGEEVFNGREIYQDGGIYCLACARQPYCLPKLPEFDEA